MGWRGHSVSDRNGRLLICHWHEASLFHHQMERQREGEKDGGGGGGVRERKMEVGG